MRLDGSDLTLSATDLANFLACRHRTALDMAVAVGARSRDHIEDPLLEVLWMRGAEHEKRYIDALRAEGLGVEEIGAEVRDAERIERTLASMRSGVDVIVQGGLADGRWFGKPDVMRRVARPSALGDWSYEIADTKLARETRAGTILQLGLYSEMLAQAQGVRPEHFHVVTPAGVSSYRVDDYGAYFRLVRDHLLATAERDWAQVAADNYPDPVDHCEICPWSPSCRDQRRADDHLSLVANISRTQRRELESRTITTLTALAELPVPLEFKPKRGSRASYERAREQARLQLESRDRTPPLHELLAVEKGKGLSRLPKPSRGDLFLDLEGDEFATETGGREYLFGIARADGTYESAWAFTDRGERTAFEWVMDTIAEAVTKHPKMHVYHYAPYEVTALKRLMGKYATRERELDAMLRAGRFVDLYAVVRQGLRAGIESYSIKRLEPLYKFKRTTPLADANRALRELAYALETGRPHEVPDDVRAVVAGYNRDDCVSAIRLRHWLEKGRTSLLKSGAKVPRASLAVGDATPKVGERTRAVESLRGRLLEDIKENRDERNDEQQGRWLLAYMLDFHRREDKALWWDYFRLCGLAEEDLFDERDAVAGLEFVERVEEKKYKKSGKPTGSVVDRYRYPPQEMEVDGGKELRLQSQEAFGKVVAVDRLARTIDVLKGRKAAEQHPSAVFAFTYVSSEAMEESLARIGEDVAAGGSAYRAARSLLAGEPPRLKSQQLVPNDGESASDFAVRIATDLDDTVLAIQGPPGAGKTTCGARMICAAIDSGLKVGIAATSHKVIDNLLRAVHDASQKTGTRVRLAHKVDEGDEPAGSPIACLSENADVVSALASGKANVVGGTAWLWAREDLANAVDVLFVDEAGQMALANVIAVSQAAKSVVLLGDPQQLEQPRKGSHPDGVAVSALEHMLRGERTMPSDRGIFLPVTWRLAPSICEFTSEVFYDGRLTSRDQFARQRIAEAVGLPASGLAFVPVEHDGNKNYSMEEVDAVVDLVARLTAPGVTWRDADDSERQMTGGDVLVVAPYNSQVTRLAERLECTGVRVGTVDKFQGQQAPVAIYSMATSRPEDAPRGMDFLYSLNRLNVATSRAKCLAILVASPRLLEPECRSPRQMKLANGLCRFRELAK
jgi:predicted RecB family nuclease